MGQRPFVDRLSRKPGREKPDGQIPVQGVSYLYGHWKYFFHIRFIPEETDADVRPVNLAL